MSNVAMLDSESSIRLVNPTTIIDLIVGFLFMNDDFNPTNKTVVINGDSLVTPAGTQYLAKAEGSRFTVSVYSGKVRLTSHANPATSFIISPLQQVVRINERQYGKLETADVRELERAKNLTDRLLKAVTPTQTKTTGSNANVGSFLGGVVTGVILNKVLNDSDDDMPTVTGVARPTTDTATMPSAVDSTVIAPATTDTSVNSTVIAPATTDTSVNSTVIAPAIVR
jgi:hypothetical protein